MTYGLNKIPKISEEGLNKFLYAVKTNEYKDKLLERINNGPICYLTNSLEAIYLNDYSLTNDEHGILRELCSSIKGMYREYPQYSAVKFYIELLSPSIDPDELSKTAQKFQRIYKNRYNLYSGRFDEVLQKNSKKIEKYSNSYANNNHKVYTPVGNLPTRKESEYYSFDGNLYEKPKRRRKRIISPT